MLLFMHATKTDYASFETIRAAAIEKLNGLSPDFTYHNLEHTLDVTEQCERIAKAEGVLDERQIFLLKVAALYHDTGFLYTYKNHEEKSCEIFLADADAFGFSAEEKEIICRLIMVTKLPQTPQNLLEKVICDADLDYLGRPDFFTIGDGLRREFLKYGIIASDADWDRMQTNFLTHHHYHTETSRSLREEAKQQNIAQLPGGG